MPMAPGVARAGRRTGNHEHEKSSECAKMTGRSKATNGRGEIQRHYGGTPEFYSQLRPTAHPSCRL
ncbi:MAG: hypothetical protein ACLQLH_04040 [Terracidiphilus sp.]